MVHKIDTEVIKGSIDLRELARRYTILHTESIRELAGPCPKCGGNDRFHVNATSFMCRQCHTQWGDAIEFVRWVEGIGFRDAVTKLGGIPAMMPVRHRHTAQAAVPAAQTSDWMEKAKRITDSAHERLLSPGGQAGADYLLGRGLPPHVWQRFGLGFRDSVGLPGAWDREAKRFMHPRQPAIVIPWHDEAGQVKAIRYRFLQQHEYHDAQGRQRQAKQKSETGSQLEGMLYGWPGIFGGCQQLMTLLICEGELNALSIWQVQHNAGLDVLSLGSESQRLTSQTIAMAQQYQRVIVWADKNGVAWQLKEAIPGAHGCISPDGLDANDLLRVGKLGAHLAGIRYEAANTDDDKEALLWDLHDAARLSPCVDVGTSEAIAYIAKQLGKQVSLRMIGL